MSLMGCSRSPAGGGIEAELTDGEGNDTGIVRGHAYSITRFLEISDPDMTNPRKTHRLIHIRNPWGAKEWLGTWSGKEDDEKLEKHRQKIEDFKNEMEADEQFEIDAEDGLFFMNYKSFRECFDKMFIAINFPDHWTAVRYNGYW